MRITNEIPTIHNISQEQKEEAVISVKNETVKSSKISINAEETKILKSMVNALPPELKQAITELYEKGLTPDKDTLQILKTYMNKFIGSQEEKIEVIKTLLGKDLEINLINLNAAYEALYGKELSEMLLELGINSKITEKLANNKDLDNFILQISNMKLNAVALDKISDFIDDALEILDINIDSKRVLIKASNEIRQAANYRMDDVGNRILDKALNELGKLLEQKKDRPDDGIFEISDKDKQKIDIPKTVETNTRDFSDKTEDYVKSALASLTMSGKDFIVTQISKRLNTVSQSFKELKLETAKNLDMVIRYINEESRTDILNAQNTLEKTIDKLDKVILKGDITLFTDMETEKELVRSSSDLAKAKEFLEKGEYEKAWRITEKVKDVFEKINWKPSDSRIVHFAKMKQTIEEASNDKERFHGAVKNFEDTINHGKGSGRMIYEVLRVLGADHEGEAARYLVAEDVPKENIVTNIKSSLLKMLVENISQKGDSIAQMADKITGQQLLSRSDKGGFQSMFFSLPLIIGGRMKDVKLFINSKKEKEKLDWENCSIYFLIETKKLGETGILLSSSGRNLTINLKNDREDFEEDVKPLLIEFKENLIELGYEVGNIVFTKFNNKNEAKDKIETEKVKMHNMNSAMKGFDIKI